MPWVDIFCQIVLILLILILLQIVWGAYVAGLNAGKVYNSWPMMGEQWVADGVTAMSPIWKNFVEGIAGVQFIHRYLAYIVVGLIIYLFVKARKIGITTYILHVYRYMSHRLCSV